MKVKCLVTGKILEVNASYGCRLIEQGKAVLPEKTAKVSAPKRQVKKDVTA